MIQKGENMGFKYNGSLGWLIFFALFLQPVALVLLIVNLRFVKKEDKHE